MKRQYKIALGVAIVIAAFAILACSQLVQAVPCTPGQICVGVETDITLQAPATEVPVTAQAEITDTPAPTAKPVDCDGAKRFLASMKKTLFWVAENAPNAIRWFINLSGQTAAKLVNDFGFPKNDQHQAGWPAECGDLQDWVNWGSP